MMADMFKSGECYKAACEIRRGGDDEKGCV